MFFNLYRQRLRPLFPSFELETAADPFHAKHDKIDITIGDWFIVATEAAFSRFVSALPGYEARDHDGQSFRVFSGSSQRGPRGWPIYKGGTGGAGAHSFHPSFSGKLNYWQD